jgi:hypothetical protein
VRVGTRRQDVQARDMSTLRAESVERVIEVARRESDGVRSLWWEVSYDGGAMSAGGCVGEGERCEAPLLSPEQGGSVVGDASALRVVVRRCPGR